MRLTEMREETRTNDTNEDGRSKHQTWRARAQDGQQSKQDGRLKQRGRAHV